MEFWSEIKTFVRESRDHFHTTGAILPSSRALASTMAAPLRHLQQPGRRILEVGPGTGSITRAILAQLRPDDRLELVELNDRFVDRLRHKFAHHPAFTAHRDQVRIIHDRVEALRDQAHGYDHIISGLPLNNFPVEAVAEIFEVLTRILKPGGMLTYFEYAFVRHLKTPFTGRCERQRLRAVGDVVGKYIRECEVGHDHVLRNVPPAVVRHLILTRA